MIIETISEILLNGKCESTIKKVLLVDLRGHFDILQLAAHLDSKTEGKLGEDKIKMLLRRK